jgi:hypothetical protein
MLHQYVNANHIAAAEEARLRALEADAAPSPVSAAAQSENAGAAEPDPKPENAEQGKRVNTHL